MNTRPIRELIQPGTLPLRAAALTYYSFLGVVPLATLSIAVVEELGLARLSGQLRRFFAFELGFMRGGAQVGSLLSHADARGVNGFAVVLFALSGAALLVNVEAALNEVFHAGKPHALTHRAVAYAALFTLGPICLGLSLFLTGLWRSSTWGHVPIPGLTLVVGPFGLSCVALYLLYRYGPSAHVSPVSALAGAAVAGPGWELAKQVYASMAVATYHRDTAIYGPYAAIPVLLLWIQLSWIIVLVGARVAFAAEQLLGKSQRG